MHRALPILFVVDDEPKALEALTSALARRFGADYAVLGEGSPHAALERMRALKDRNAEFALVIADQQMPEMDGLSFLTRSRAIDPEAKRALLVAWGDRRSAPAILRGCAFGQLDNYLLKPFEPAEVHLYPVITEFLMEWTRGHRPPLELVRVVGGEHSRRTNEVVELLERNGIPHGFHDLRSEEGRALLAATGLQGCALPVVIAQDGGALCNPSNGELADLLGVSSRRRQACDVVVVGGGPAGLAAAVYAASEGLRTVVVEREAIGGQAAMSTLIRNYLGFPRGITGAELAQRAYQQAWLFGTRFVFGREASGLRARHSERIVTLSDGSAISCRAVLIATGARYRRLEVPSLERFVGAGVFYTALTDPRILRGRDAFVVGGGNSAGQAVVHLAQHARTVTLLLRGGALGKGMSDYLVRQIRHLDNVEVRLHTEVVGGEGEEMLTSLELHDRARDRRETVPARMLFVLIGAWPHTLWLEGTIVRDVRGFLLTGRDLELARGWRHPARPPLRLETSIPGVFAVGDVRAGSSKRVASAVGEGAVAVQLVHEYIASAEAPLPSGLAALPGSLAEAGDAPHAGGKSSTPRRTKLPTVK
jgi:thioredoxin reductase (NADPH)